MDYLGINIADWIAIGIYLVGITIIGVWTVSKVKDTADFFMGGRTQNKWFMMFFAFGAGTSGNDAVGVSAKTYTSGMSGIWYQWLWLFCTPFYWLIAPVMRRMRCLTTGDYYAQRYDGSVEALYSLVGVLALTFNMGVLLRGGAVMVEAISGGAIEQTYCIVGMTVLFLVYGMAGGLTAAIITDFIQGILTVILSFMLLPVALKAVGGMTGLRESIADESMFTIVSPGEITGFYIFMLCSSALIGIVTQPHIMGVCAAGKTEYDGRFGFATGNLLKRFCTVAWMVVGLCGVALYPGLADSETDTVYGLVAKDLLPTIMPGLIGLFLAALLASIMSSCDAFMVSSAGLFTQNYYRRHVSSDKSEKHYVFVGRIAAFVIVSVGMLVAFTVSNVPAGLVWFFKIQALMGPAFWLGLFWRRTTVAGAWVGTLLGLAVMYLISLPAAAQMVPESMLYGEKVAQGWQILLYLGTSFISTILVSFVTPRVASVKLDRLFDCIRTPVEAGEEHMAEAFTLPADKVAATPTKIINHPDIELYVPTRQSLVGFAFFWACVGGLIWFVYWLAGVGA